MDDELDPWRMFWLASEVSAATGAAFAVRINDFAPPLSARSRFVYPRAAEPLTRNDDGLARLLAARRSSRAFAPGRLPGHQLGSLFGAFAGRVWPSAGALYPLEVFALLLAVDHPLDGRAVHYEPDLHGLTDIGPAPPWAELTETVSGAPIAGEPQVVVLFVLDMAATEAKYGNRGGRFALIEVGHAAQNLALRLAADGLAGCELGGTHDRALLARLGLTTADGLLALGYACGLLPTNLGSIEGR